MHAHRFASRARARPPAGRVRAFPSPRRRAGQALVLCLVLLFGGALSLVFLFSTGQVSATRQRLDNAADAAAWSAALWRARVMNYHAYANRAIVAQEVAVAQAVTLTAWAKYFEQFTQTASVLAAGYPPVAAVLRVGAGLARSARELAEEAAAEEIPARSAYKTLLVTSQEILQRSVDTFGLGAVANEIARANDPSFFAFALPDEADFARMTRRYVGPERARLKSVVDQSLDAFTTGDRGADMTLLLMPSGCFGNLKTGPETWFQELRKRGGTVMTPEFERWESADTMSLHDWRPKRGFLGFSGCHQVEALPLGWGASEAYDGALAASASAGAGAGQGGGAGYPGALLANPGHVRENPGAALLAEAEISGRGYPGFAMYSGIAEVRDLDYAALANPRFPVSRVAVLARVDADDVRTANQLNLGVGRLRLSESLAGGRLWSLGAAEVYFRRPGGAPERVEYASLYSPYWQVRLVEPTEAQRALANGYVH